MWNIIGGPQKLTNFILKFYFYLPKESKERKPGHGTMEASSGLLSTCLLIMEFRFDAMLCSILGTKILMRDILKFPAGRKFPTPGIGHAFRRINEHTSF